MVSGLAGLVGVLLGALPAAAFTAAPHHHLNSAVGSAVAIAGSRAVVSAPCSGDCVGTVSVFARTKSRWRREAILREPSRNKNNYFGGSVAVSGATVVVTDLLSAGPGVAYIFARIGQAWHVQARLSSARAADSYASQVAISGNTVIVGDVGHDALPGYADVYVRTGTAWHWRQRLAAAPAKRYSSFGTAIAMTSTMAVIGAAFDKENRGAAYVFTRSGSRWHERARLIQPHAALGNNFGDAVAVSGTTVVVGAFGVNDGQGRVFVYGPKGRGWVLRARLAAPNPAQGAAFGAAVAVSGRRIVVGEPTQVVNICGTAWEFAWSGTAWRTRARVINPHCSAIDEFGSAIALAGTTALIGAPGKNNNAGAAYVVTVP